MANYQLLKADIDAKVYENAYREITGENLNSVLNAMVTTLGAEYQFAGVATIDINPGTPDAKVFYIANGKGTYTNFGGIEVTEDDVVVLYWDSSWHKVSTGIASQEKLSELELEVSVSIYDSRIQTPDTNPLYENTIDELYINQDYITGIDYVDFRCYGKHIYMFAFRGSLNNSNVVWSVEGLPLTDKSNGQIIPLICTSGGGDVSVGDIVGYVVFKDIDTFKSISTGSIGNVLNLANVTRLYRQQKISNYLFGADDLGNEIKKLSDDTKKLESEINGEIDFVDSFSMVGNGTKWHQKNASTIDISAFAGKEITVSLGSVSSSASTTNSCIVGYVQTAGGESLNETERIKAGNSKTILLPSNAAKILIQAFPAYNVQDVDGATYTFSDINIITLFCIEKRLEALESERDLDLQIQIPDEVFAVVGTELNIWNDTVSYSIDRGLVSPLNYAISWKSNVGQITDRGYHFTPIDANAGNTYTLKCIIYGVKDGIKIAEKNISIKVKAKNALASAKNIIFFGDSTGASSATALYNDLHNSERYTGIIPTMFGSRGTSTIRYEAFGGAQWSDYATAGRAAFRCFVTNAPTIPLNAQYTNNGFTWEVVEVNVTNGVGNILITRNDLNYTNTPSASGTLVAVQSGVADIPYNSYENAPANPLWDSTQNALSISHYKDVLGISQSTKFDAVFFQLGLNHSDLGENFENLVGYITALYNLFVNDNPDCIVILGLTTTAGNTQDGSGVNYGASIPPITHNIRMYNLRNEYIKLINGGTMPNLRIAPTNNNVDRYYGYDFSQRTVNYTIGGVSKSDTIMYHNNMVHPGPVGYEQMGDAYFSALIGFLLVE